MPFKDTKSGSTHYQDDGCGEPAHNTPDPFGDFLKSQGHKVVDVTPKQEECKCTTKYCKHYKSDFDKFVEDNPLE